MLYDIVFVLMFIGIIWNSFVLYYYNVWKLVIKRLSKCDYIVILKCIRIICTLFLSFFVLFYIDNEY